MMIIIIIIIIIITMKPMMMRMIIILTAICIAPKALYIIDTVRRGKNYEGTKMYALFDTELSM